MQHIIDDKKGVNLQSYQRPHPGFLPRQTLTELMGKLADKKAGLLTTWVIRWFIQRYGVNMAEAAIAEPEKYDTFNDFFTRALKKNARTIDADPNHIVSPVDAVLSQFGRIHDETLIQAKGHKYSLTDLLAGDCQRVEQFKDGSFATYYLSPKDYHRIHMPTEAKLLSTTYVPGTLYSVSLKTADSIPNLFAKNERLICYFESQSGPMATILVGATIVGSIETIWAGQACPPRSGEIVSADYTDQNIYLGKGDEMGRFKLGSTVIMLHGPGLMLYHNELTEGMACKMGESHGRWLD